MAATEPIVAIDDLPSIAPIRTKSPSPAAAAAAETGAEDQCSTPTSEDQRLKAPLICPPAPRKPRVKKRKLPATTAPVNFYVVTRDLSAVFRSLPPKKRIRVAG